MSRSNLTRLVPHGDRVVTLTVRLLVFLVLATLLSGCGSSKQTGATTEGMGPEPKPCRAGTARTISESTLKHVFTGNGIRLYRNGNADGACSDRRVLVSLSNVPEQMSNRQTDSIDARQGTISCDLLTAPSFGRRLERFVWRNDHRPTYVDVLNVDCAIHPANVRQVDRLERTLRRLPGVSDAPAAVPSEDATGDPTCELGCG
jgi:hypothetical protein